MDTYNKSYEVRWADMDPNRHMRHSVYLDYAAQTRVSIFSDYGLSINKIAKEGLGPVLFREEIKYWSEVRLMERITVHCKVRWMYKDASRWSFLHQIFKGNDIPVADLIVDGAWIDLNSRRLGAPPESILEIVKKFPRTEDFQWSDRKKKAGK